jgi:3-hydroxybutyryl-CoA dehydratase
MQFREGQSASLSRVVTAHDVEAFAQITGDTNPVHLDAAYAAETRFGARIAHGMLAVSYISAVLGTRFPGPGTIYLSQNVSFLKPVFLGDTITATVTVSRFREDKGIVTFVTECWNQAGEKVVDGQAVCLVTDVAIAGVTPGLGAGGQGVI